MEQDIDINDREASKNDWSKVENAIREAWSKNHNIFVSLLVSLIDRNRLNIKEI